MKRFVFAIVATLMLISNVYAIGPEHSGSWYNANEDGHGFSIGVGDLDPETRIVVVYWYTYDSEGFPVFLTGAGSPVDNRVEISFAAHWGMIYGQFDPNTHKQANAGVATFEFLDESNGTFDFVASDWAAENFGFTNHQMPMTKLLGLSLPEPEVIEVPVQNAVVSALYGSWDGWRGDTIIKLLNGQQWQQVGYRYEYTYDYMPDVVIYNRNGYTYAAVEGSEYHVSVVQIK